MDKDVELFQQTFDGTEVEYEEATKESKPKPVPRSFLAKRTLKPKDHPRLFEVDEPRYQD